MTIERTTSLCSKCPLCDRKRVNSISPDGVDPFMALLGEAPGEQEDFRGEPFVGPAGRTLDWALGQQEIRRDRCHVMNVINCRPPNNNISGEEGSRAIDCCRAGLYQELRYLKEKKVEVIVALGVSAMNALGFKGSLQQYRGSVLEYPFLGWKFKVVPTFHPAAIRRSSWSRDGHGKADSAVTWLNDLAKARSLAKGNWETLHEDFVLRPTVEQVESFVDDAVAKDRLIAVDTETTGLHFDFAKIVVIGLADSKEHAISVPLLIGENQSYWQTPADEERVRVALKKLFRNCRQIYQNCFFDVPLLRRDGFEIPNEKLVHDTILLHHTIAPEDPHKLGFIVSVYGKTPFWKEEFQSRQGSIFEMDQDKMWTYNLRDCVVLHQVLGPMQEQLKALKAETFYSEEVVPLIDAVLEMKSTGVCIDMGRVGTFKNKLTRLKKKKEEALKATGGLPAGFNLDSDDHLRWFLFGAPLSAFATLSVDLESKRKGTKIYQKLTELKEIWDTPPIYILESFRPRATDTGKAGVGEQALQSYRIALVNRLAVVKDFKEKDGSEEQAKIERLLNWLDDLHEFSGLSKLVSTYTNYRPLKDGRIHPNWKQHGTVSGRLSCLAGSTKIQTSRGEFELGNYVWKVGDRIVSHTGEKRNILGKIDQGRGFCFRLTIDDGRSIICTDDHKFFTPFGWRGLFELCTGDLVFYVDKQESALRSEGRGENSTLVFESTKPDIGTDLETNKTDIRNRCCCDSKQLLQRDDQSDNFPSLFEIESRGQISNEGENWKETSELEGSVLGQKGTPNNRSGRREILPSQGCDGEGPEHSSAGPAIKSNSAPHRRESREQQTFESSVDFERRSSYFAPKVGIVVSISPVGTLPIFDLSVAVDNSFVANGFLVHNCTEPNLMNLPKPDAEDEEAVENEVREFFVAPEGSSLLSADYVNLEAALLAYEVLEPDLLSVFTEGKNLHDINTRSLFGIDKEDPRWPEARKAAKVFFFGGISYGGGPREIFEKVSLAAPKLHLTFADFVKAQDKWFAEHPRYVAWKEDLRKQVENDRFVTTEFGRVRFFLGNDRDILKQALDYKIQSSGASVMNRATVRILRRRDEAGLASRLILQVHDQLIFECPNEELEQMKLIQREEMEKPFIYKGIERRILVEQTVGKSYAEV